VRRGESTMAGQDLRAWIAEMEAADQLQAHVLPPGM
jgi:hypothetical protein